MADTFTSNIRKAALAGAMLALSATTQSANAEIIRVSDMLRGMPINQPQCAAIGQAVWVTAFGQSFCIRYYVSTAGGATGIPTYHLSGDKLGTANLRTLTITPDATAKDIDTKDLIERADIISKSTKAPAIYLARVGIDGSSGNHASRRTFLELHVLNAAIDKINQRYGYNGFHINGQSGGGGLIGGLLALRSDILCAVSGSGTLASVERGPHRSSDPTRDHFFAADNASIIARKTNTRIIVITDPQDMVVKPARQTTFVNAVRQHGKPIEQYFVQNTDESHHAALPYAIRATALCAQGAPEAQIAADLDGFVKRRVAAAAQARRVATNSPMPIPPVLQGQPVPMPRLPSVQQPSAPRNMPAQSLQMPLPAPVVATARPQPVAVAIPLQQIASATRIIAIAGLSDQEEVPAPAAANGQTAQPGPATDWPRLPPRTSNQSVSR